MSFDLSEYKKYKRLYQQLRKQVGGVVPTNFPDFVENGKKFMIWFGWTTVQKMSF